MRFEFEDTPSEEFGVSSYNTFGDVVNGVVVMDSDSGAFSVTWSLVGAGFQDPMHLTLHLKNEDVGNMVTLSGFWNGGFETKSVSFSSNDEDFSPEPGLIGWAEGNQISTSGSFENSFFVSGLYSEDLKLIDPVEFSGKLEWDSDTPPPGSFDMDADDIPDDVDEWNQSDTSDTVFLLDVNTWIPNRMAGLKSSKSGHTLADIIQLLELAASEDAKHHGQYVQELVRSYKMLVKDDVITQKEHTSLIRIIVKYGK